jgi:acyl-CoA thioesterase-1
LVKKILVLTDSLGLPRSKPEVVTDEQCWAYRMTSMSDYSWYLYQRGGYTSDDFIKDSSNYLSAFSPDIVIIQMGIVDCAPRALSKKELAFISLVPFIGKRIKLLIKKNRQKIILYRKLTYVDKEKFKINLQRLKRIFQNADFIAIPILPANQEYEYSSPGVSDKIWLYNQVLKAEFDTIDLFNDINITDLIMSDNHHLNAKGHDHVCTVLKQYLQTHFETEKSRKGITRCISKSI